VIAKNTNGNGHNGRRKKMRDPGLNSGDLGSMLDAVASVAWWLSDPDLTDRQRQRLIDAIRDAEQVLRAATE
jgi:hypothetical protein